MWETARSAEGAVGGHLGYRSSVRSERRRPDEVTVVGVGADGWPGLSAESRAAIEDAEVLFGGKRQLDLVPESAAVRVP